MRAIFDLIALQELIFREKKEKKSCKINEPKINWYVAKENSEVSTCTNSKSTSV